MYHFNSHNNSFSDRKEGNQLKVVLPNKWQFLDLEEGSQLKQRHQVHKVLPSEEIDLLIHGTDIHLKKH